VSQNETQKQADAVTQNEADAVTQKEAAITIISENEELRGKWIAIMKMYCKEQQNVSICGKT
jgi:hypothetical protein